MIEKIEEEVIKICDKFNKKYGYDYWNNHIKYVVTIAKDLAKDTDADMEVIELSALLHDISSQLEVGSSKEHNIISATLAEDMLQKYSLSANKIEKIKKCIVNHNCSKKGSEMSVEEQCIRNADVLSIFYNISLFYYDAYNENNLSYTLGKKYVRDIIMAKYQKLDVELQKTYKERLDMIIDSI